MGEYMHKEFPKTVGRNEFWKQIKRTVNGKEVSENDISDIVKQISDNVALNEKDHLLDLGCGNGALASNFFSTVNLYTGVDFSEYLLGVAKEYFNPSNVEYIGDNAENFINKGQNSSAYTKILIYGVMSYFDSNGLIEILTRIKKDFVNVNCVFIGNIPNRSKAKEFYDIRGVVDFDLDDNNSAIGTWWSPEELMKVCNQIGYKAEILYMPASFYGAKYRYDILLKK